MISDVHVVRSVCHHAQFKVEFWPTHSGGEHRVLSACVCTMFFFPSCAVEDKAGLFAQQPIAGLKCWCPHQPPWFHQAFSEGRISSWCCWFLCGQEAVLRHAAAWRERQGLQLTCFPCWGDVGWGRYGPNLLSWCVTTVVFTKVTVTLLTHFSRPMYQICFDSEVTQASSPYLHSLLQNTARRSISAQCNWTLTVHTCTCFVGVKFNFRTVFCRVRWFNYILKNRLEDAKVLSVQTDPLHMSLNNTEGFCNIDTGSCISVTILGSALCGTLWWCR